MHLLGKANSIGRQMTDNLKRIRKFTWIITCYPIALIALGVLVNLFVFGVPALAVALPQSAVLAALAVSGLLLVLNHTWLMTATELARLNHNIYASPEEWSDANAREDDVLPEGWTALTRHHNAHRNATENTVLFAVLAAAFVLSSPGVVAAQVWLIGFGVGRLGYTYGALRGKSGLRGAFMSVSLIAMYGLSSHLVLSLLV